jgi:putative SOS response-associated peptidase YedK
MCGRYILHSPLSDLADRFQFGLNELQVDPNYNISPTASVLTVVADNGRNSEFMRWGFIPKRHKTRQSIYPIINARSEYVHTNFSFKNALSFRRCLIPANGFYEWIKEGKQLFPILFTLGSNKPFAFAGLWEASKDEKTDQIIKSCTILTTMPNELVQPIHNRMPVILSQETESLWLDPMTNKYDELSHLLSPYPSAEMKSRLVSRKVNSVKNNGPELINLISITET